jgi:hypothetical protein
VNVQCLEDQSAILRHSSVYLVITVQLIERESFSDFVACRIFNFYTVTIN